jgi:FMN phosphatase YigB (HAD superfamily)
MATFTHSLPDFKVLSFDCYGTLIDWEIGIYAAMQPVPSQLPSTHPYRLDLLICLSRFNELQGGLEIEQPTLLYRDVLSTCYGTLATELGLSITEEEKTTFGRDSGSWDAFPDAVTGLQILAKHYKLISLSNVDHENVKETLSGPLKAVKFDAVYTAQDVGS